MDENQIEEIRARKERRNQINKRSVWLFRIFAVLAVAAVGRILYLQYSDEGAYLRSFLQGEKNFAWRSIKPQRGNILTHDNKVLATTIPMFHLYLDFKAPAIIDSSYLTTSQSTGEGDKLASALASFFKDKSAAEYKKLLDKGRKDGARYRRISPRRVDYLELQKIRQFPILSRGRYKGGLVLDTLEKRELPYGELAKRTIGKVLPNRKYGVEGSQDSILKGVLGRNKFQKVSGAFWIPIEDESNFEAIDGLDVVSTIDIEVQDVAERYLREQVEKHGANWGTAILMDVKSGEIRALANIGKWTDGKYYDIYNYGVGQNMEPGSTFKLVSLIALLDECGMTINDIVDCGDGVELVGPYATIRDTHHGGYGKITVGRMFEVSSNIGFARSIYKNYEYRQSEFPNFIYRKKFDQPFNFGISGEATPDIRNPKSSSWNGRSLAMMAYGYELKMTPIHTLAIYNAIANNGAYIKPKIVKGYSKNGVMVEELKTDTIVSDVASPKAVSQIREVMERVANDGTAKVLVNPYYRVAGKTGTAQVAKGNQGYHYDGGRNYLATIVGYFPAENPKYSCIVAMEIFHKDYSSTPYYGGTLSGPVFRAIADKVYSQAVDWGNDVARPTAKNAKAKMISSSDKKGDKTLKIKGGESQVVNSAISKLGIRASLPEDGYVTIDDNLVGAKVSADSSKVPNLVGMGLRDAIYIANTHNLKVSYSGVGAVWQQTPKAGESYKKGDTITISLK